MNYKNLIIFVLVLLCFNVFSYCEDCDRKIFALVLNANDPKNQKELQALFNEVASSQGFNVYMEGLELNNMTKLRKNNIRLCQLRMFDESDFDKQVGGKLSGSIRGNLFRKGISSNSHFFVVEQETLFSIDFGDLTKSEVFSKQVRATLSDHLIAIKRNQSAMEKPLFFSIAIKGS